MPKIALPALVLCILALFSYSVTSQSNDAPAEFNEPSGEPTQKFAQNANQDREPPVKAIDRVDAELSRLSDEAKANSAKIAQTATLRSDLLKLIEDTKASSDKVAQNLLDQINAMRSDQEKSLKDVKDNGDRAAQALRDEVAASQTKLVVRIDDALKANAARSDALSQRLEVMNKEIGDVKKNFEDDQQSRSNLSPGFALLAALAALVLGPFVAYQLTANQLAGIKQQAAATTARTQTAEPEEVQSPPASHAAAEPPPEFIEHESPPLSEEASFHHDAHEHPKAAADEHPKAAADPEKV